MGFAETMIASFKNNRRPRRSRFEHEEVDNKPSDSWKKVLEHKATPAQLKEIKLRSVVENEKTRYKKRMAFALTLIILGMLFTLLYFFL